MNRRLIRWVPAIAAPAVLIAAVVAVPVVANATQPNLPGKSAAQVLELMAKAKSVTAFSGTVSATSNLGLPSLPTSAGSGSASSYGASDSTAEASNVLSMLTGTHTLRVYASGKHDTRVQVLQSESEQDVVTNSSGAWIWDSEKQTATHVVASTSGGTARTSTPTESMTPAEAADELVSAVGTSSTLSVGTAQRVAKRDAYTLTITPTSSTTLVGSASIAIDAKTGVPLKVSITARGASSPAISTEFTTMSYTKPAASLFTFTPPKGATVKTVKPSSASSTKKAPTKAEAKAELQRLKASGKLPSVSGTGWSSVIEIPAKDVPKDITDQKVFTELTTAVSGGRALKTALLSVLVTTDGRVLIGAVPVSSLEALAG